MQVHLRFRKSYNHDRLLYKQPKTSFHKEFHKKLLMEILLDQVQLNSQRYQEQINTSLNHQWDFQI